MTDEQEDPMAAWYQYIVDRATPDQLRQRLRESYDNNRSLSHALSVSGKIEWTAIVFEAVLAHARQGGTYRVLIYERLGFDESAYAPLYYAGGMDISNEFVVTEAGTDDTALAERLDAALDPLPVGDLRSLLLDARYRIAALSAALDVEQEKRRRMRAEIDGLATKV
jgi:hypothetical protein